MDKIKQIINDLRIDGRGLVDYIAGKEEAIDKIHKYIISREKRMLKRILRQCYLENFNYVINRELDKLNKGEWIELMQYTGLKDKNGNEIYESDIVKRYANNGLVKYIENKFVISIPVGKREIIIGNLDNTEVIGNIYENPELLGAKWV